MDLEGKGNTLERFLFCLVFELENEELQALVYVKCKEPITIAA